MSTSPLDFGISIAHFDDGDAFFIDTNFVIAVCDKNNKYHKASSTFFMYLVMEGAKLCISEVVVMETMHILARVLYAEEQYFRHYYNSPHSDLDRERLINKFTSEWPTLVKKDWKKHAVGEYNEKAWNIFRDFYEDPAVEIIPSSKDTCLEGIKLSSEKSLLSADSLIVNLAEKVQVKGLISMDRDVQTSTDLKIFTTRTENEDFNLNIYKDWQFFEEYQSMLLQNQATS